MNNEKMQYIDEKFEAIYDQIIEDYELKLR
jgi:hypothetical protein